MRCPFLIGERLYLRAPLLDGAWPSGTNLAVCAGAVLVLWILAALTAWRGEERVILYL